MDEILSVRSQLIGFYKRHENIANFILRYTLGLFVFSIISKIGMYRSEFEPLVSNPMGVPVLLLISLLFTISPPTIANMLIAIAILIQISISIEVSVFVFLFFVLILTFYVRLAPEKSYFILAIFLGYFINLPYVVILFAGLFFGLSSITPIIIGTMMWSLSSTVGKLVSTANSMDIKNMDIMELPSSFMNVFSSVFTEITSNFDWVYASFVFSIVIVAVYFISRLDIDYSKEIAIISGGLINIIAFAVGKIVTGGSYSILLIILLTIISCLIVEVISFFHIVLDYKKSEKVQFQDDDNYYYVKVIPKINNSENTKNKIHAKTHRDYKQNNR